MKRIKLPIATTILVILIFGILIFTIITYNKGINDRKINIDNTGMKIIIENTEYSVKLSNNNTTLELLKDLPYLGRMANYEESFYVINLEKEYTVDGEKTKSLEANNVYYNPYWKALILVYKDYEYPKNKMVHIGKIDKKIKTQKSITEVAIKTKND